MSDTHNEIEKVSIRYGHVFVHCGNAVDRRTSARDLINSDQFVGQLPHTYKVFVSGNYCICLDSQRKGQSQQLLSNMIYIQDQLIDVEGVCIYGSPWRPKRGCFYQAEASGYDSKRVREDK